jgi:hypothetical protein
MESSPILIYINLINYFGYIYSGHLPGFMPQGNRPGSSSAQREKIIFEIFHNGQQVGKIQINGWVIVTDIQG